MDEMEYWELGILIDNYTQSYKQIWESNRMVAVAAISPYLSKGDKKKKPQDLFPIPSDKIILNKANVKDEIDMDEYAKVLAFEKKIMNSKKQ